MSSDNPVIFVARKRHVAQAGQPPVVEAGSGQYTSYFENRSGEQWIFVRDRGAQTATLYGGDIGWDEPKTMSDPPAGSDHYWIAAGLVLNEPEALWLTACWAASEPPSR